MIKKTIYILVFVIICLTAGNYFLQKKESACHKQDMQIRNSDKKSFKTDILTTIRSNSPTLQLSKTPCTDNEPEKQNIKAVPLKTEAVTFEKDYRKKLEKIKEKLIAMDFDFKKMTLKLHKKLKTSKNGKLSKEEMLKLLPENIAKEFEEAMEMIQ